MWLLLLDEELLDLLLYGGDLGLDLGALVLCDGHRDDGPRHAAGATQSLRMMKVTFRNNTPDLLPYLLMVNLMSSLGILQGASSGHAPGFG